MKKAGNVVARILKSKSLKGEVVTGTTSKALLKAIDNALIKGLED